MAYTIYSALIHNIVILSLLSVEIKFYQLDYIILIINTLQKTLRLKVQTMLE